MRIEAEFESFARRVFGDISEQQYIDLRRTFMGGASAFYFLISNDSGTDEETEQFVKELRQEIYEFNEAVKRGEK